MPYFYLDPSLFPTLRAATLSWPRMSLRVSIMPWSSPWAMWQMSRTSALKASSVVWTKETKFSWASFTPSASQLLHSSNDRIEDPDIAPSFSLKLSSGEVVSIIQKITEERFWNTISKQYSWFEPSKFSQWQDFTFFKVKLSLKVLKTYQVVNEESIITFFSLPRVDDFQTRENLITFLRKKAPLDYINVYGCCKEFD